MEEKFVHLMFYMESRPERGFFYKNFPGYNDPMKRSGRFFVYILRCSDDTLYTGYTPDLARRLELHNNGRGARYTRTRRPVTLAWFKEYRYFKRAFMAELRIKKFSRARKEKLIARDGENHSSGRRTLIRP